MLCSPRFSAQKALIYIIQADSQSSMNLSWTPREWTKIFRSNKRTLYFSVLFPNISRLLLVNNKCNLITTGGKLKRGRTYRNQNGLRYSSQMKPFKMHFTIIFQRCFVHQQKILCIYLEKYHYFIFCFIWIWLGLRLLVICVSCRLFKYINWFDFQMKTTSPLSVSSCKYYTKRSRAHLIKRKEICTNLCVLIVRVSVKSHNSK